MKGSEYFSKVLPKQLNPRSHLAHQLFASKLYSSEYPQQSAFQGGESVIGQSVFENEQQAAVREMIGILDAFYLSNRHQT
jgi:hypothetical protein